MAKAKTVLDPYDTLELEVLACAKDLAAARAALAKCAAEVAKHQNESKDWAPDLAAPTAFYTLAKDRYDAIRHLFKAVGEGNYSDMNEYPPYVHERKFYDTAYPPSA